MAVSESGRPVPEPDEASAPFFDAAQRDELALQRCATCGAWMWPVKPRCVECWSAAVEWKTASGRATVYSYAIMHGDFPGFQGPYVLATIETDEGVRFTVNLADDTGTIAAKFFGRRLDEQSDFPMSGVVTKCDRNSIRRAQATLRA